MRVLVEQSAHEAEKWIGDLVKQGVLKEKVPVHVLMGGVEAEEWYLAPEKPAVLIGTQDMLLSRVLNRGYAASRFHWPIDFGLLNNDCLWVFDEPQLMGSGVSTSAQLAGLRGALGTLGLCPSVWMSATLEPCWLDTIDFRGKFPGEAHELDDDDYDPNRPLYKRMTAAKLLAPLGVSLTKEADDKEAKAVAAKILEKHREALNAQTLVVMNTVRRAKKVYEALLDIRKKEKTSFPKLLLVHSRFRPQEREFLNDQLQLAGDAAADRIMVATQVVEAGVDISARTLVTELAPWASIVQRIGRCNRTGNDGPGRVFWIDLETDKQSAPYDAEPLTFARKQLEKLAGKDVSPKALDDFKRDEKITLPFEHTHVVRRRDLLDLFDTAPDLSGNDIDVARFIRGDDEQTDLQVFWREVGHDGPLSDEPSPHRRELCNVPISEIKAFLEKRDKRVGYTWDHLEEEWRAIRDSKREVRPGMTILLPTTTGGYSTVGWDPDSTSTVIPVPINNKQPAEGTGGDPNSCGPALTIAQHTQHVCDELGAVLGGLADLPDGWANHLAKAARWHDVGKAHAAFQQGMRKANLALDAAKLWAKSGNNGRLRHGRKYFRHELASALAALQHNLPFEVAYLILAHHGKVRLSIRTLSGEDQPNNPNTLFAHGVHDGDPLPDIDLGGETCPAVTLDLTPMRLGGEASWTARALELRDNLGPFRLAYLEALLRAADLRASQKERGE
jgi:CRISPR-associated endonuclease/helicase Cas3